MRLAPSVQPVLAHFFESKPGLLARLNGAQSVEEGRWGGEGEGSQALA
jgi:hypothetical protein